MFQQKITDDIKIALKSGDSFLVGTLRLINAAVKNKEIEKRFKSGEIVLSEDEITDLLSKEAKKRKEAMEIYKTAGRNDLFEKEEKEFKIIEKYLPEQLSEKEIEEIISKAIDKTGAKDIKEMGRVMGEAMKELKSKADAKMVGEIIKKKLST